MCCATALTFSANVIAANEFVVKGIKVEGIKRLSVGTVLNYLPVQVGEEIDSTDTAQIIRALYDTGFFQSVTLERQGNILIVNVVERETIGSVTVTGNQEIAKDKMKEFLKEMGLVKGRVFQKASLERFEKEIKQAYTARGKYNAYIETKLVNMTENRVGITITISEGRVSRIKKITITGNHDFSSSELLSEFSLSTSNIFTYFSKKDQYVKPAMDASLEALRTFYLDRGYLKFAILSSQVQLSPDKKDVYINVSIEEGPQYRFSGYDIRGNTIVPQEKLQSLIDVKKGEVFSRKKVTSSISAIGLALGDEGFGFPTINAEPKIDETNKTVFITFVIDPGRHVYVRHINFRGNTRTSDDFLRNVIRQNEGSLLSLHNIKESERQLRVLGYLKNIDIKTTPVPGANNQVDLDVNLEEAPSSEASMQLGYGTNGPQFNIALTQKNFMGTGRNVGLDFNFSQLGQSYSFNYYNPFYTQTGIGRGFSAYFVHLNPKNLDLSRYASNRVGGDVSYNVPLSEKSSLQFGYGYQNLSIQSVGGVIPIQKFVAANGLNYQEIRLSAGWNRNTYDQHPFPIKGINQQFNALVSLPAASRSLSYYKTGYQLRAYQPMFSGFIFTVLGNINYGNSFNSTTGLPFFENYYAGGIAQPGQVRGYETYSLGPQDNFGNSLGGNFLVNASAGVILPYPLSWDTVRTTAFVDAGNVYAKGIPVQYTGTSAGPIRYSAGASIEWRSPFGPLAFSLAQPLNKQPGDQVPYFQLAVSGGF